jgi:hypothetical protein
MKKVPVAYLPGRPWAICDRCGFKLRHDELRLEWTNLMVCDPCLDPLDPLLIPPKVWPEGIPIKNPRPYPPDVFVGPGDITEDDL